MLLLLFILANAAPGTSDLNLPPVSDPWGRWIATSVALLAVAGPIVAAKIQARKSPTNGPAPTGADSTTPRLDVTQQYLERYVASLEKRVELTEAKYDDLDKKYQALMDKYSITNSQLAATNAQLEAVHHDNLELRDEVHTLRGRLRGRE